MRSFDSIGEDSEHIFPGDGRIQIQVDYREKPSGILEVLRTHDANVTVRSLSIGDYVVNDFATIERKTAHDFLISIVDSRLFTQVSKMKTHCQNPILLIEGDVFETDLDFNLRAIKGSLISICAIWRIPVLFSDSLEETAEMLVMLGNQERKYTSHLSLRKGYRPKKMRSRQLFLLQGLPLIGPQIAARLLERFGTVERVLNASDDELLQVEGVGKGMVRQIQDVLKTPCEKSPNSKDHS